MTRRIFLSEFPRDLLEGGMVKTCPFLQQIPFFCISLGHGLSDYEKMW